MHPAAEARQEFVAAFAALVARIADSLTTVAPQARPIRMIVAGGAAMHLYTGVRVSHDVDAIPLSLPDIDASLLDIRLLAPLDLAVSKLARFAEVDRGDITELARKGLIHAEALRQRASEALVGYVGDLTRVRRSIEMACNLVDDCKPGKAAD